MVIDFSERPIDRQVSAFLCRNVPGDIEPVRTILSLLSQAVGQGSICLDLAEIAGNTVRRSSGSEMLLPGLDHLRSIVQALPSVGRQGEHRPLVLDDEGRLYLYRYFRYQQILAGQIFSRTSSGSPEIDEPTLIKSLDRLFPQDGYGDDRQRQAASTALKRRFSVISGGPGTGKTSTVVRILCLLLEQPGGLRQRIAMAAPTGKAAARLSSSIVAIRESLQCSGEANLAIPEQVTTIHRLLGTLPGSTGFRHSDRNPLPYDTVIVDEASMIDLPLMTALITALLPDARLILLGDKEQLASVEAGAVLGDICRAGETYGSVVENCVTVLEKNYRFSEGSGISELSRAVNAGDDVEAMALMDAPGSTRISLEPLPNRDAIRRRIGVPLIDGYRGFLEAEDAAEALRRFERFRILCALRDGPWGAVGMNNVAETVLSSAGLLHVDGVFYCGRPLLVTENDYVHRLFNGDTGIILPDPSNGSLRAYFAAADGSVRSLPPEFMPKHETAFAMTVHKSQGSEFERVLMILPPEDKALLTRELIYTGITRAKESLTIWGDQSVFASAVRRRTERRSGLLDALGKRANLIF
ncbi:MAG: exodeoxyribonuclease V subunit alpha [Chlorobiaceae bacterium]|nr:exodeoxyribonuclease V subunit alpha [Chlorobiaceae bacterium]